MDDLEALAVQFVQESRHGADGGNLDVVEQQNAFAPVCQLAHDRATDTVTAAGAVIVGINVDGERREGRRRRIGDTIISACRYVDKRFDFPNWITSPLMVSVSRKPN